MMKMKNNYKIKGIKNFLPAYCDYTTPKGKKGFDELYYSISSLDAVKDIKNIDYIGFWKENTCWGDECGHGECLSANKPYYYKARKNIKKRRNNILTMFPGEDWRNPSISKIYYKNKLCKFYFNYSSSRETPSLIRKAVELKKKNIFDKFTVKNKKLVIFCLAYLKQDLEAYFYDYFTLKILKKKYGYSAKVIKKGEYSNEDYNKASKDFEKMNITFCKEQLIKLPAKDKKELLNGSISTIDEDGIYEVPNGNYIASCITSEDIYGEHDPGTFNPLGYLVELQK